MSFYREQLEEWLSELDVKADTVLDIGGAQKPVKGRTKSWDVKDYKILDLPEFDLERASTGKLIELDIRESADVIFCLEVFEYLISPLDSLKTLAEIVKQGGKIYATLPFVYPHHNELELDSLRYTESGIKRLAEASGLRISDIWYRRDKSGLLRQFYAADGMRAAKEYPDHSVTGFIVEFQK